MPSDAEVLAYIKQDIETTDRLRDLLLMRPIYTPDPVHTLYANQVFVFGSNRAGRHGRGAAKDALKWGAKPGQGEGLMGQTYGIPTKGRKLEVLSLRAIGMAVARFLRFAVAHPESIFLVTPIGCGLAHYKPRDIAPLFWPEGWDSWIPANLVLPESFWDVRLKATSTP